MACLQMSSIPDQALYNNLPSLQEADDARKAKQVDDIISGPLRDVFFKHGLQDTYCLYLQHRRHVVKEGEAVIKVNGTAHVMSKEYVDDIASFGNKIVPATWMTCDGKVVPMELAVVSGQSAGPVELSSAFISNFMSVLAANDCEGLFGVDTLAPTNWAENSIGNSSVVVTYNGKGFYDKSKFVDVAFAFNDQDDGVWCHGRCGDDHDHTKKHGAEPAFRVHGRCGVDHDHTKKHSAEPGFRVHSRCGTDRDHTKKPSSS